MKSRICIAVILISLLSGMSLAAPSFLGQTGLIFTPNDINLRPGEFSANFHSVDLDNSNPNYLGFCLGLTENLELSLVRVDFDAPGDSTETALNAKYSILDEAGSRPSFVVGVTDAGGNLDPDDDPGFYALVGKTLATSAPGLSGSSGPIRGYLGFGTGVLDGLFGGLDWAFSERASLMLEFVDVEDSMFNAGVRFAIAGGVRGDVALIDGEDLGFGISFTKLGL